MFQRQTLSDSLSQIDHNILKLNEKLLIYDTLLFGNPSVAFRLTLKRELLFYV